MSTCGGGSWGGGGGGGVASTGEQEGILCVWGGASTGWNGPRGGGGRCPNVEVQHLRKREYPDEVERGAL